MNALWIALIGLAIFFLGYRFYSRFIAQRIYRLDPDAVTPAHEYNDGVDYVPTNKFVLWGHHFSSIAGAAPILGPAVAVFWGWLPALLWVVLGTVFAAGVHDFGAVVLSARNKGRSVATIAERIIGPRSKMLFSFIILILLLMVNAVFAWVIANLFVTFPASVISIFIQIPLAMWIGYTVYKKRGGMFLPALAALVVMYGTAVLASKVPALQIDLVKYFGGPDHTTPFGLSATSMAFLVWIVVLMVYVYFASTLPVWKLLQPRDYINSHQLVVGLAILYLGLIFSHPSVHAPATNPSADKSWFPLLFITIACGAISGFHSLVGSGTTAKQLDKETDARFVGYAGAVGEGALALVSIIAVVTLFKSKGAFTSAYSGFDTANGIGLNNFIKGAGQLAEGLAIPPGVAQTIVSIIVISFAATSLDTSVRLMRYIVGEFGTDYKIPALPKPRVATTFVVVLSAALVLLPHGPKGFGSGGYLIWPLFGTSNQLLAGITLLLISIWLRNQGRNAVFTAIPGIFLLFMTIYAMVQQVFFDWMGVDWLGGHSKFQPLLFVLGVLILVFAIWVLIEGVRVFVLNRGRSGEPQMTGTKGS